ncbi:MAG TPA: hypothetical protein VFI11_02640 [Anaerolineales bacterium]|nr:hypothetical protein [Anaerolineales bacterium]
MNDTQLPRFEVFVQERRNGPHLNAGSVHAADAELALLNARDVFARRPECHGLWIVPADRVTARTAEQLAVEMPSSEPGESGRAETYRVFGKIGHKGTHEHLGRVEAASAGQAIRKAFDTFGSLSVTSWWVVPESACLESAEDEADAWFKPAQDKPFRDQAFYPVETFMRSLRRARESKEPRR